MGFGIVRLGSAPCPAGNADVAFKVCLMVREEGEKVETGEGFEAVDGYHEVGDVIRRAGIWHDESNAFWISRAVVKNGFVEVFGYGHGVGTDGGQTFPEYGSGYDVDGVIFHSPISDLGFEPLPYDAVEGGVLW